MALVWLVWRLSVDHDRASERREQLRSTNAAEHPGTGSENEESHESADTKNNYWCLCPRGRRAREKVHHEAAAHAKGYKAYNKQ